MAEWDDPAARAAVGRAIEALDAGDVEDLHHLLKLAGGKPQVLNGQLARKADRR